MKGGIGFRIWGLINVKKIWVIRVKLIMNISRWSGYGILNMWKRNL